MRFLLNYVTMLRRVVPVLIASSVFIFFGIDCQNTPPAAPASGGGPAPDARKNPIVRVDGNRLLIRPRVGGFPSVNETPWEIRGIAWGPYGASLTERPPGDPANPKTTTPIPDSILATYAANDINKMAAANINTVRTYQPFDPNGAQGKVVLDLMHAKGMKVAMTLAVQINDTPAAAVAVVNKYREHEAILLWIVGNELDLNCLYTTPCDSAAVNKVNEIVNAVRNADTEHPVAVGLSDGANEAYRGQFTNANLFALNVYRGRSFGNLFTNWAGKPFFLAEYGIDAWDVACGGINEAKQADFLDALTIEIQNNSSAQDANKKCIGGCPFEWNDEWWKNTVPENQFCTNCGGTCTDSAGIAPNDDPVNHKLFGRCWQDPVDPSAAVHDRCFNEQWWGIVTAQRQPRAAYAKLQARYANRNP